MKKIIFLVFLIYLISLGVVNANSVCGYVENSENFSASWLEVSVYYSDNPSEVINCQVNPENKFCCGLEELTEVGWQIGLEVTAEIFQENLEYVAGPVTLIASEEGYDVFPDMKLEKPIKINSPIESIFINQTGFELNVSLIQKYNNLKYLINSSDESIEQDVCLNCEDAFFEVPLFHGENTLKLIAYGEREFSETLKLYNLDYLEMGNSFSCRKCRLHKNVFYVPSNFPIKAEISFNSSHKISGEILNLIPIEWSVEDSSEISDYSSTHNSLSWEIYNQKEFSQNYTLNSPTEFIRKKFIFKQKFFNFVDETEVFVFRFFRFYHPFYSLKKFSDKIYYEKIIKYQISPEKPLVIYMKDSSLNVISLTPTKKINNAYLIIKQDRKNKIKKVYESFSVYSNVPDRYVENVLLMFKLEKEFNISFYDKKNKEVPLELYKEDSVYKYYRVYLDNKQNFNVEIW